LLRGGTMPLPMDVQLLPVYVWEQVRGRPFSLETEYQTVLQAARAGNLIFLWLLLYFAWKLGRRFGGDWAGRLAVPLIACDPNFLAHASLATTDIAVAACLLMFMEKLLAGRAGAWRQRVGIPGLCFGAALLAKASALPFAILTMLVFEAHRTWKCKSGSSSEESRLRNWVRSLWRETSAFRFDFCQIISLGLLTCFIYCGSDWRAEPGFGLWVKTLPPGPLHDVLQGLADNLCIFPNAGQGLVYQIQHNFRGHGAYVVGEWHERAVWYYFPLAMTMKLTLPVLLLLAATLFIRPKSYAHGLGLLVAFLFLFTLNCRVQIGIRLILPVLALLMVALAVAIVKAWPARWPDVVRPVGLTAVCLLVAAPMLQIWPHGLCYINPFWGGPENGYQCLSDSNYDWGQGLGDLQRWQRQKGRPPLKIWYYGADPRMIGKPQLAPLHLLDVKSEDDLRALVGGNYLAVGTTLLYSNPSFSPSAEHVLSILKTKQPVARTMTFFIYDFTEPMSVVAKP
jgi:hypothetical protein